MTITVTGNGASKTVQSQADGSYSFIGLAPGGYTATISVPGFQPFSGKVTVAAGATATLPIQLSVTLETQQVTVSAENRTTVSVEPGNNGTALVITSPLFLDPTSVNTGFGGGGVAGGGPGGGAANNRRIEIDTRFTF